MPPILTQLKRVARVVTPAPVQNAWGTVRARTKSRRARLVFEAPGDGRPDRELPIAALPALMRRGYQAPAAIAYDAEGLVIRASEKVDRLAGRVPLEAVRSCVELGCWDGMVLAALRERMPGIGAFGADRWTNGIDARALAAGARFVQTDASQLAFASDSMDLVYSFAAFEHFADTRGVVEESWRILRPGGRLYLFFGPVYTGPFGLHAYRQIPVPYCHYLFAEEDLKAYATGNGLPTAWPYVNGVSVTDYRRLFDEQGQRFERLYYLEHSSGAVGAELIAEFPFCFRSKVPSFDDLLVSAIEVCFPQAMIRSTAIILGGLLALACAIAGLQILVFHNIQPAPDSIAYFEVADQIQRVGYAQALSLHWSPLYPLYLLAVRLIAAQPLGRELLVTTVADAPLLVALCGIVGAVFVSLGRLCFPGRADSARAWLACACGLSIFFAFGVLRVGLRLPDALVTSLAILVLWAWCHAMTRDLDLRWSALAGLFSGLAFLARANLLHWSLVVGAAACLLAPATRRGRRWTASLVFALGLLTIVGPQVAVLSSARGHLTFGESGKLVFAETYGATWPDGRSAWPIRASGGDVRVFTDARDLNFPGFYEPGREYDDAIVPFQVSKALLTVVRSLRATLFGYWSPSFALMWPLLWALWPACVFGVGGLAFLRSMHRDEADRLRHRLSWFLIVSGAAGVAMHLVSFSLGYYLPPYLIPLFMGIYLAMLTPAPGAGVPRAPRHRAAWIMAAGFCLVTVLSTASGLRRSDDRSRAEAAADTHAIAAALERLPTTGGRRRIAVAGSWLGVYAIRLSNSQVTADIPDPAILHDSSRSVSAVRALRDLGVVAILGQRAQLQPGDPLVWTPLTRDWALADIRAVSTSSSDGTP